jgi:DNA-binding beta-propeller fold protein YncE
LGYLLAYDLHSDEVVWVNTYEPSIDSPEVSPDGQTIYMGCGEERADCDWWFVLDAATGEVESKIPVFIGPHNTIVGSSGERVYLASLKHNYLSIADTRTNKVIQKVGPFGASIRPFTINESESLTFVTVDHLSGFEIGDLKTGEQLYRVEVKGFPWEQTPTLGHQSHGIALTPDEREVWVVDGYNRYLHVFDVTGLPTEAPRQIASIALRGLPKWINFSRDGRFAHVSSGEIVEAATREIVTRVSESRYFVQIDFENGLPVQAYSRYGLGYGEAGVDQATD